MHNDRLTYAELTHSMFGGKFDYYLTPDIMKCNSSGQPQVIKKVDNSINMPPKYLS